MKPYVKPDETGSAVRLFLFLFLANGIALAVSLLIVVAIFV